LDRDSGAPRWRRGQQAAHVP